MACVEDSADLATKDHARPSTYTLMKSIAGLQGSLHYSFDSGELACSYFPTEAQRDCYVVRGAETTLAEADPSFVYLDVGCWADDADGKGTHRRDFGLVCGPHVYLCEYVGKPVEPSSRIPAVRDFFHGMANLGCGARVLAYARAKDLERKTWQDSELYLLLGDLHLPPATWFYRWHELASPPPQQLPGWLERVPAMARQKDYMLHSYYDRVCYAPSTLPKALYTLNAENPDIFGKAGLDAARFLRGLASLDQEVRARLHLIHLGDMFELWIGRGYHLVPGADGTPRWRHPDSPEIVANWCLEVMIQNAPVFTALDRLERAGLAEVKYLGGNHDGYLMKDDLAALLALPVREPFHLGQDGNLFVEHGHRFDGSNHDDVDGAAAFSGPWVTRWLLNAPQLRKLEGAFQTVKMIWAPKQRKVHFLGATLLYLCRHHQLQRPFGIYAMGHTHARMLGRLHVRAKPATAKDQSVGSGQDVP